MSMEQAVLVQKSSSGVSEFTLTGVRGVLERVTATCDYSIENSKIRILTLFSEL